MSQADLGEVWARSLEDLSDIQIEPHQRAWLRLTRPLGLVENTALIATPNEFVKEQLETRLRGLITHALSREFGRNIQLAVTVDPATAADGTASPREAVRPGPGPDGPAGLGTPESPRTPDGLGTPEELGSYPDRGYPHQPPPPPPPPRPRPPRGPRHPPPPGPPGRPRGHRPRHRRRPPDPRARRPPRPGRAAGHPAAARGRPDRRRAGRPAAPRYGPARPV